MTWIICPSCGSKNTKYRQVCGNRMNMCRDCGHKFMGGDET